MLKSVLSEYESAMELCNELTVENAMSESSQDSQQRTADDSDLMLESALAAYESALRQVNVIEANRKENDSIPMKKNHIEDSAFELMNEIRRTKKHSVDNNCGDGEVDNDKSLEGSAKINMIQIQKQENHAAGPLPLTDLKLGSIIEGYASSISHFGVFIEINYDLKGDGTRGLALLHKSQVRKGRNKGLAKYMSKTFQKGEKISGLKVINIDHQKGKVGLSLLHENTSNKNDMENIPIGSNIHGVVSKVVSYGAFVDIGADVKPLVHISKISRHDKVEDAKQYLKKGDRVRIKVISKNYSKKTMEASMLDEDPSEHLERLIARRDNESKHPQARENEKESSDFEISQVASNDFDFLSSGGSEKLTSESSEMMEKEIQQLVDETNRQLQRLDENNKDANNTMKSEKISTVLARKLNEFIQYHHGKFVMKGNTSSANN